MSIAFGVDRLVAEPGLLGNVRRVGLLTNDAARLASDAQRHSRTALLEAGVPVVRLFAPEHGLSAHAPDGSAVNDGVDQLTGLPVVSLYGATVVPPAESLSDLDCMLFDVPDVGVRFYTYNWTLSYAIDACAVAHLPLFVLDRPNPLGGLLEHVERLTEIAARDAEAFTELALRRQAAIARQVNLREIGLKLHKRCVTAVANLDHWFNQS